MMSRLGDALFVAAIGALLMLPFVGIRTSDGLNGLVIDGRWGLLSALVAALFLGRLVVRTVYEWRTRRTAAEKPTTRTWGLSLLPNKINTTKLLNIILLLLMTVAFLFPFSPFASRYTLDVLIMVMTYIVLAYGLNIVIGYAGLLDLGYAGFYAIGAYGYALLAINFGLGFWQALPMVAIIAACIALCLGLPVLRLRGDYFAIVTLGFGEIVRLVLINWTELAGGPNGMSGVPRPTLFGIEFAREAEQGMRSFHEMFGIAFDPAQRVIFLYLIILFLAACIGLLSMRLRKSPLGRAWEAFREDDIAVASVGVNRWTIKLAAYSIGALIAALAGAFFATRQGFISPESFTFTESATILAIVILGGAGHALGIILAAVFIIGLPELFREFEQFRILAFGAGMVLIMLWRPGGLIARREPSVLLPQGGRV